MSLVLKTFVFVFVLGVGVAASIQPFTPTGWWLNSFDGVEIVTVALFLLGVSVSFATPVQQGHSPVEVSLPLWCGVMVGFAVALVAIGPGNLFPIVLAVAGVISAVALGVGMIVGFVLRCRFRGLPFDL